jgi:putative ABC transport system substrate-binding protein
MKKQMAVLGLCFLLAAPFRLAAQQPRKVARICYLGAADASNSLSFTKPFRERLREIGYIDGQNLTIEFRESEGKVERLPGLAAELVRLNCDVIVTNGNGAAQAAKNATKTIPIVMGWGPDAVRRGIVSDLARPAGNITGLTDTGAELYGKRLELLKEVVPKLARVAFLWTPNSIRAGDDSLKETESVARYLRVEMQFLEVKVPNDIDGAFRAAANGRANGLMVSSGGFFAFHRKRIIDLAEKNRLPRCIPALRTSRQVD